MAKLVCAKCECELRPELNGVGVIETMDNDNARPYKLWVADLWKCPGCEIEVVSGFSGVGEAPMAEHWSENFDQCLEYVKNRPRVYYDHERPNRGATPVSTDR